MGSDELRELRTELDEFRTFGRSLRQIGRQIRWVIGVGVASIGTYSGAVIWVSAKSAAVDSAHAKIATMQLQADHRESERRKIDDAWADWRRTKDDLDIKIITLMENFQRQIEAYARAQERQQEQLNRLEGRR